MSWSHRLTRLHAALRLSPAVCAFRWVDSYLSALLGAGLSTEHFKAAAEAKSVAQDDADANIAAKYYVNQILNLDEGSIQQAWLKVGLGSLCRTLQAGRWMSWMQAAAAVLKPTRLLPLPLPQVSHKSNVHMADQDDARLQYLSWRVWGMKRKHATVQLQRDAEADLEESELSETRSEELTGPIVADAEEVANLVRSGPSPALPRLTVQPPGAVSAAAADADVYDSDDRDNLFSPVAPGSPVAGELVVHTTLTADRVPKLYCVLISMHGLVRGDAMELGKDPDTGGQVRVVAVCVSLAWVQGLLPATLPTGLVGTQQRQCWLRHPWRQPPDLQPVVCWQAAETAAAAGRSRQHHNTLTCDLPASLRLCLSKPPRCRSSMLWS